jgi:DHHC palmitoyltransferase
MKYLLKYQQFEDRISNRCISRMDHFCPWMNNAIGARNQKNFMLFLIYTDIVSAYMYVIVAWHMVYCTGVTDDCTPYSGAALQLVRVLIFILLFAILFTSSMILNQIYGLAIGLGTIDRYTVRHQVDNFLHIPPHLSFLHPFASINIS